MAGKHISDIIQHYVFIRALFLFLLAIQIGPQVISTIHK